MKIAQIVAPGASEYERKSQRVDFAALSEAGHQVGVYQSADVAHVYGRMKRVRMPHVVDAELAVPEAVEEAYWSAARERRFESGAIGTALRKNLQNIIQQTHHRLARTRDDIEWRLFERPPAPEELAQIAVWVDPALGDDDKDGFVAEALVAGNVVVASRTTPNVGRLEKGRTGLLVPPNDPNELTHAILAALFKPELGQEKLAAARQTISKFRPRQRLRALVPIYESLLQ
jgi:glycosyltransferase involved in cell wall biosynthesis